MNAQNGTVKTHFWHKLEDGRVQCDVCPRACKLHEGQRGFCFVRANQDDGIVLTSYGLSSGFCVDPIEKKPLSHFLPGTSVLSFGTAGCNLGCQYCQNWDMSKSREMATLADRASPEQLAQTAGELDCRSVAFTYNDPVVFMEYADDVAEACREQDIRTVAVTSGYMCPEPRREFYSHLDAVNIDFKGFNEAFYSKICSAHLEDVKDTLCYVKQETDVWMEITTLIIPGENDSEEELNEMSAWVVEQLGPDVPWHFSAFHPDWKMKDVPATPPASLRKARDIARASGVRHVYVGNVHDEEADSTYCHDCGRRLIGRDWYELTEWSLTANGSCPDCGTVLAGIFEEKPGTWGRRRMPVKIA